MSKTFCFEELVRSDQRHLNERLAGKNSSHIPDTVDTNNSFLIDKVWFFNAARNELSKVGAQPIKLRDKTAGVLKLLIEKRSETVLSHEFFERIWLGRQVSENVLKQSIKELRLCLGDNKKSIIKTLPKQGYTLSVEVDRFVQEKTTSTDVVDEFRSIGSGNESQHLDNTHIKRQDHTHFNKKRPQYRKLTRLKKLIKIQKYHLLLSIFLLWAIMATYLSVQSEQQAVVNNIKRIEAQSKNNFYQDILDRYHNSPIPTPETLKSILKKSIRQIDAFKGPEAEKVGMLFALMELYTIGGFYEESRIIVSRIENLVESVYGEYSKEYIELRFNVIEILIKLNNRQEALKLSQLALSQVKNNHGDDRYLLAQAYYYSGKTHLYCVAPFCNRSQSLKIGQRQTREALSIYQSVVSPNSIEIADTLWLLNWFVWDGQEKLRISELALNIYQSVHGNAHEKTAEGLEQLARTHIFWQQDWVQGERLLFQALEIRKSLYPANHPELAKIHSYLGEYYFMAGEFELAIDYLNTAIRINTKSLGEGNDQNLQNIMLIARSHLYRNHKFKALHSIKRAFDIIEAHKITPSDILYDSLLITQMRVKLAFNEVSDLTVIEQSLSSLAAKYKYPSYLFQHEYLSQIQHSYPEELNEAFISNLQRIVNAIEPTNRYFYEVDFNYLKQRTLKLCTNNQIREICSKAESILTR